MIGFAAKMPSMTTRRKVLQAATAAVAVTADAGETNDLKKPPLDSEKFRDAILAGDLSAVTSMLDRDPALRYARDADGVSMYLVACLKRQPKVAEELARRGLVLDIFEAAASGNTPRASEIVKDDPGAAHHRLADGRTPIHIAAEAGKPDMVTFFGTRGAGYSAGPESPLLAAVDYPDHEIASAMSQFLMINASDPNARRKNGSTVLHVAAARGYADLVELLIHRGADTSVRDAGGKLPLEVAKGDAIRLLRDPGSVERVYYGRRYTQDLTGNAPARQDTEGIPQDLINQFVSVAHNNFEKVKQLQKLCPTLVMTHATWDEMAIEAAAHMGLVPMAQFLADLGAPVSTCTATILGAEKLVKRLVTEDKGCMRERGAHDLPLLAYTAFGSQQADIAQFLLDAGADVHVRAFGQTTLHLAAAKGHVELARLLLDRGADVNAVAKLRKTDMTPLAVALQAKQSKIADLLTSRGGRS